MELKEYKSREIVNINIRNVNYFCLERSREKEKRCFKRVFKQQQKLFFLRFKKTRFSSYKTLKKMVSIYFE